MLEALLCTQDWLRWSIPIDIEENLEELIMLEKGITFFHLSICFIIFKLSIASSIITNMSLAHLLQN
jgi:hypothetical protein